MTESKNVDYLSRLPPELLQYIFNLSHNPVPYWRNDRLVGPPSRFFQPFFNRSVYSKISLPSYESLELLCCQGNGAAFSEIVSLSIVIEWYVAPPDPNDLDFDSAIEQSEEDPNYPASQDFVRFLSHATSLRELDITGSTRLSLLVLSPAVAVSSLPNLRTLILDSSFDQIADPFHPIHYLVLPFYPSLETFYLSVQRSPNSISSFPSNSSPPSILSSRKLDLVIYSSPDLSSASFPALVASVFNLVTLSLKVPIGGVKALDSLRLLSEPTTLQRLYLKFNSSLSDTPHTKPVLNVAFSRFSELQTLIIDGKVDLSSPSFYRDLGGLVHLDRLYAGQGTKLSISGITRLVNLLSLESLNLDNLEAFTLPKYTPVILFDSDDELGPDASPVTIQRPEWTAEFSRDGFKKLVEKCLEQGVKLEGETIRGSELEDKFDSGELEEARLQRVEEKKRAKEN